MNRPGHVKLFMLQCEEIARQIRSCHWLRSRLWDVAAACVLLGIGIGNLAYRYSYEKNWAPIRAAEAAGYAEPRTPQEEMVFATLYKVKRAFDKRVDVNGDRKTNCIDAAVLFYQWYPERANVRIVSNRNDSTNFYHAFNEVWMGRRWEVVEPQTLVARHKDYSTWLTTEPKYDARYNIETTNEYARYVKR